jgi:hypothetical protein
LTRYRVRLTEERGRSVNRVQKTLEGMNLKLGDVVSDIMGKASRMILRSMADGESDPVRLAGLAVGRVRASQAELEAALTGTISEHHRFLLREHLVERITAEIARWFTPPEPKDGWEGRRGESERARAGRQFARPSITGRRQTGAQLARGCGLALLDSRH